MKTLAIVIPAYGKSDRLVETAITLCDNIAEIHKNLRVETILIDNGRIPQDVIDNTIKAIENSWSGFLHIQNSTNRGVTGSWNQGLAIAGRDMGADYVMITNDDIHFGPCVLQNCIAAMERDDDIYMLCPNTYSPMGEGIPQDFAEKASLAAKSGGGVQSIPSITGHCFILSKQCLDTVGWFDPRFDIWHQDSDYCIRLAQHNKKVWVANNCLIHHHRNTTVKTLPQARQSVARVGDREMFHRIYVPPVVMGFDIIEEKKEVAQRCHGAGTYSVLTSFNKRIFENAHQYIFDCMAEQHSNIPFFVYHEKSFDLEHNGVEMRSFKDERPEIRVFDLFEEQPKIKPFAYGEGNPFTHAKGYWNQNSKFWARKVFAIADAINKCETEWLIWADADVNIHRKLDNEFWSWAEEYDVAYIERDIMRGPDQAVETGFIVFRVCERIKTFAADFLEYYLSKEFVSEFRWDDSWGFSYVMGKEENNDIRKGFFRNDCLTSKIGNVSPFDISEYISHAKGPLHLVRDKEGRGKMPDPKPVDSGGTKKPKLRPDPTQKPPKKSCRIVAG